METAMLLTADLLRIICRMQRLCAHSPPIWRNKMAGPEQPQQPAGISDPQPQTAGPLMRDSSKPIVMVGQQKGWWKPMLGESAADLERQTTGDI